MLTAKMVCAYEVYTSWVCLTEKKNIQDDEQAPTVEPKTKIM